MNTLTAVAINADTLAAVAARAAELELSEASVSHLRREWPGIHFTFCGEDDVPARLNPVLEGQGFNLYLVNNADHCVAFTSQLEAATGIVLATVSED
jgi:hypothetical protein